MFKPTLLCLAAAIAAGSCGSSLAGTVTIDPIGGGLTLHSADLSATVFGAGQPYWSEESLASVHASLNASGVSTDGKVTTVLADTDHGLALLILIDQQAASQGADVDGHLHMASFGNGANLAYINDVSDSVLITPNSPTSRLAMGDFDWNSNGAGDGFGWANLQVGNTMTFHFDRLAGQDLGLEDPRTFQFVTWNGAAWELASLPDSQASFTDAGEYGFSIAVIPLPAGAALGALPLAGLAVLRRRRA
jgi:hypothetical protein